MLLPCDQPYLRAAATQRPTYPVSQSEYLPYDVERLLSKLVQKELKLARESERLKQELASRYDCNYEHLYKEVDDWGYKAIDSTNLKRFLIKTGVFPSDALLIAIIRRFDLDADAKLKNAEFIEGIKPQLEYSRKAVKDHEAMTSSRGRTDASGMSASKSRNMRSASKGRSAKKSKGPSSRGEDFYKSRDMLSSSKKSSRKSQQRKKSIPTATIVEDLDDPSNNNQNNFTHTQHSLSQSQHI